jgi:hypothetical protein
MHSRAESTIRSLASLQYPDGGTPQQVSADGKVQWGLASGQGRAILDVGELVLALWMHVATTNTTSLLVELWPVVTAAMSFTEGLVNKTTGWALAVEFGSEEQSAAYCSAPQGKAINTLQCGAKLCAAAVGPALCPDGGLSFHKAARRASIPVNGLSMSGALPCGDMSQAYDFMEPLEANVASDEYYQRWYESVWRNHTGPGGSFGATSHVYASGETSELARSVFWSKQEVVELWEGMARWSWNASTAPGIGGFVDCTTCWPEACTCWIPRAFSDRALWAQSEALIYLTTDFRSLDAVHIRNAFVVSPICSTCVQTFAAVVTETSGGGIASVSLQFFNGSDHSNGIGTASRPVDIDGSVPLLQYELTLRGSIAHCAFNIRALGLGAGSEVGFVLTAMATGKRGLAASERGRFVIGR